MIDSVENWKIKFLINELELGHSLQVVHKKAKPRCHKGAVAMIHCRWLWGVSSKIMERRKDNIHPPQDYDVKETKKKDNKDNYEKNGWHIK